MTATNVRPLAFTLLAFVLWFLALGGMGAVFTFAEGHAILVVAFVAYAATAFVAGYSLWSRSPRASTAFAIWATVALLNGALFDVLFAAGPSLRGAAFGVFLGFVFFGVHRYVRARTPVGV